MKQAKRALAAILAVQLVALAGPSMAQQARLEVEALYGFDPVLVVQGQEVLGDEEIFVVHEGFLYLFVSEDNKALFESDPERYGIQLGGVCARMGGTFLVDSELYTVHERRIYVFGLSSHVELFEESPEKYLEPEAPAPLQETASGQELEEGAALIEKAVEAMGGAALIDGLTSYRAEWRTVWQSPGGEAEMALAWTLIRAFPERTRREWTFSGGASRWVLVNGEAFVVHVRRGGSTSLPVHTANLKKEFMRDVLSTLRARHAPDFAAAAVSRTDIDGTPFAQVEVEFSGTRMILDIDPQTGRIFALSYIGRGEDGDWGKVVHSFSDFREIDGMTLPFKQVATHNDEPFPGESLAIDRIVINGNIDPTLFERPATTGVQ